jgi:serine/threonine-protein kinase
MGAVYLAEHPSIGKKVALKVLHAEFSSNAEVVERFFREARAVNDIGHPNIVDIVDYGVIQAGPKNEKLVYFIMEYLAGVTLSHLIRTESPLPPERALTITLQVADALSASHKCNIVHRDLKPDNIMLVKRGRDTDFVKLLDFGIAKLTNDTRSQHKTRTGLVLGTPAYMSPEQCEGRANVDHRTDIYALGICLYEMLCGRVPFIGEGYGEILVQHLTQRPDSPSRYHMLAPHVEQVVMKALEKRPEMRYPTMDEFMRAMADPVGFVESHGGMNEFLARQLMPSTAPVPTRVTPTALTPLPGSVSVAPGAAMPASTMADAPATASPTTLSAASGQEEGDLDAPPPNKIKFILAGAGVVIAAAAAVFFVIPGKKSESNNSSSGSGDTVTMANGTGSATATGNAKTVERGSAASAGSANTATGSAASGTTEGSAAVAAKGSGAGSAVAAKGSAAGSTSPEPAMVTLKLTSTPDGAEIYLDNVDQGKKTEATLQVPRTKKPATITFRLKGYDDLVIKDVGLDVDEVTKSGELKKHLVPLTGTGTGTGTGHGTGKGKGKGKNCDTCLERPD